VSVLYELFSPFGVNKDMLSTLTSVINGKTGSFLKTDDRRILKNRDEIIVSSISIDDNNEFIINSIDDFSKVPCILSATILDVDKEFMIPYGADFCSMNLAELTFPVIIRHWKKGDYFFPFGMSQKKKLSDYFTDRKFSLADKEEALVLVSDNRIVWIIGERADNRFRITPATKKSLVIRSVPRIR